MRIQFPVLIAVVFLFLFSCKNKPNEYLPATTVLEGQLTSAEAPLIYIDANQTPKAPIDPSGNFVIQCTLDKPGIYPVHIGEAYFNIFLVPGDRLTVTGDVTDLGNLRFKGSHAVENNYLIAFEKLKSSTEDQDFFTFYSRNEADYIQSVNERTQQLVAHQQDFQKANGSFDQLFAELITDEINYDEATLMLNYPSNYEYIFPDSSLQLSDTYDSFLQNIDHDDDEKLSLPSYKNFLLQYLNFEARAENNDSLTPLFENKFKLISQKFQNQKIRDLLYYELLKEGMMTDINGVSTVISEYTKLQQNDSYHEEIIKEYSKWKNLLPGKPSPKWTLKGFDKKQYSSSNFNGEVLYIDIWATWCGPCLRELPSLAKLATHFKSEKGLKFISISIDDTQSEWAKMVKEKQLHGIQLIAENGWNSDIVSDYKINGIPRFIIVGKDGNIINANAPRPSSKEIIQSLKSALQQ